MAIMNPLNCAQNISGIWKSTTETLSVQVGEKLPNHRVVTRIAALRADDGKIWLYVYSGNDADRGGEKVHAIIDSHDVVIYYS